MAPGPSKTSALSVFPSPPRRLFALLLLPALFACSVPRLDFIGGGPKPLKEITFQGEGKNKILLVHVAGTISDRPKRGLLRNRESLVQEVVSRLRKAEKDGAIKALVLKVDSPGGTVTASDILYHEIVRYRERTGVPVVAVFMNAAASGAYYLSLPSDFIIAHPTSVTGSAGVILVRPKVGGLIEKVGVEVDVKKSGRLKDLGSPYREDTGEESEILQQMVDTLSGRFLDLIARHRKLEPEAISEIAAARVYLAPEALELGLVDGTGYLDDAFDKAKELAGPGMQYRVVVYSSEDRPDETPYASSALFGRQGGDGPLVDLGIPSPFGLEAGFYYLWLPGLGEE